MKKILLVIWGAIAFATTVHAQDDDSKAKRTAKTAVAKTKKGAKAVGNKTAGIASKGKSKIVDKEYEGKAGPEGQTIYIDKNSDYYWKDSRGFKYYISEADMKDKPVN